MTATDKDAGDYGRLKYYISGDGVTDDPKTSSFSVDEISGYVNVLKVIIC